MDNNVCEDIFQLVNVGALYVHADDEEDDKDGAGDGDDNREEEEEDRVDKFCVLDEESFL